MATRRKQQPPKRQLALSLADVRLMDLRTTSMRCVRLMPPEKAPKGSYATKVTAELGIPGMTTHPTKGNVLLLVHMTVTGNKRLSDDEPKATGPKTFEIQLDAEALFQTTTKIPVDKEISQEIVHGMLAQVYPLLIARVRVYSVDMGFRGIRPDLGFDMIEADDPPKMLPIAIPAERKRVTA